MDNASIHKAKEIKYLLDKLNIFYPAPYSSPWNPNEYAFGMIKHHIKTMNNS
jgi:transposase